MPWIGKTFRVFVSSTFNDLVDERDALQKRVFPKIRELCRENGCRFQAIDLRWGISEAANQNNRTMKICIEEIKRCQDISPKPNFIVLLGDRYGWKPIPAEVPEVEFEIMLQGATANEIALLKNWYRLDNNNIPSVYVLQPRIDDMEDYVMWSQNVEKPLHSFFVRESRRAGFTPHQIKKYLTSATEQEIETGALSVGNSPEHVYCYFRHIENLEDLMRDAKKSKIARDFIDLDIIGDHDVQSYRSLLDLKNRLQTLLPNNIRKYSVKWDSGEGNINRDHLDLLCSAVEEDLTRIIKHQISELALKSSTDSELERQIEFANHRRQHFKGRGDIIEHILRYIHAPNNKPIVITGSSGSGKSALISCCLERIRESCPDAEIIARFVGATPESTDLFSLLSSITTQLHHKLSCTSSTAPSAYNELIREFQKTLAELASSKFIVLLIDAIDQVSSNYSSALNWFPSELPDNCAVVVSINNPGLLDDVIKTFHRFSLPSTNIIQISRLPVADAEASIRSRLDEVHRTLSHDQLNHILKNYSENGLPVYLTLAFNEAKNWRSYDGLPLLSNSVSGIIHDFLVRLEQPDEHGFVMVKASLQYLSAARNGLTEEELMDILSRNESVLRDFKRRSPYSPHIDRLPDIIWSRLYFDLEPYLRELNADGTYLLTFYHRQFLEVATQRYASRQDLLIEIHRDLENYFQQFTIWNKPGSSLGSSDFSSWLPNYRTISELPYHQARANDLLSYYDTLTQFEFLDAKCIAFGPNSIIQDFELINAIPIDWRRNLEYDKISALNHIMKAMRLSAHILIKDPYQLPGQLFGRLSKLPNPEIVRFSQKVDEINYRSWIKPLSFISGLENNIVKVFKAHSGRIVDLFLIADDKYLFSVSSNRSCILWDIESGLQEYSLSGFLSDINCVAISDIKKQIAIALADQSLIIYDIFAGKEIKQISKQVGSIRAMSLANNKSHIATCEENIITVWDVEKSEIVWSKKAHTETINSVRYTKSDNSIISCSDDRSIKIWDSDTGDLIDTINIHSSPVNSLSLSDDGLWLASRSINKEIYLINLLDTSVVKPVKPDDPPTSIAISPHSSFIVYGDWDGALHYHNLIKKERRRPLIGHRLGISAVTISDNEQYIISGSDDGLIIVWDITLDIPEMVDIKYGRVFSAILDKSGSSAFFGCQNLRDPSEIINQPYSPEEIKAYFANTTKKMLGSDLIWLDILKDEVKGSFPNKNTIISLALSTSDQYLVSGEGGIIGDEHPIRVWDLHNRICASTLEGNKNWIVCLTITIDGKYVFSGSSDGALKIWDTTTNSCIYTYHFSKKISAIAVTADNSKVAVGFRDVSTIEILDILQNSVIANLNKHDGGVMSLTFSSDNAYLLSGSVDNQILVWSCKNWNNVQSFSGHSSPICSVAISQNLKEVYSCSRNGSVKVFDFVTSEEKCGFEIDDQLNCLSYSSFSKVLAVGTENSSTIILKSIINDFANSVSPSETRITPVMYKELNNYSVWCPICGHSYDIGKSLQESEKRCPNCQCTHLLSARSINLDSIRRNVFCVYSQDDKHFVDILRKELRKDDLVWNDCYYSQNEPNILSENELGSLIRDADVGILIFSSSLKRDHQLFPVAEMCNRQGLIVVKIKLDNVFFLGKWKNIKNEHLVDLTSGTASRKDFQKITELVKNLGKIRRNN